MTAFSPREIVSELDRHIIGQDESKRAVAIALRNRWRRKKLDPALKGEVLPKNILMIGPTGCGKTEIARRLARLARAPFIKVEATKFTEVGYVGRDVEQIIRDLVEAAIQQEREERMEAVREQATLNAEERVLDALTGDKASATTRDRFRAKLHAGQLDEQTIEIDVEDKPAMSFEVPGMPGGQVLNLNDMISKALGGRTARRTLRVSDSHAILVHQEAMKLIDEDSIHAESLRRVEEEGIVFLDEIDKIAASHTRGGEVSREGVQRDLLPLIEGTVVSTRYGPLKTDSILFIASGAFHLAKPADLLPELQGRLPIRVTLDPLTEKDFVRILTETEANLIVQSQALLGVEDVTLDFTKDGIKAMARIAHAMNDKVENIGARRLHTIVERVLETISFQAPDCAGETYTIDEAYVEEQLGDHLQDSDLSKFIL